MHKNFTLCLDYWSQFLWCGNPISTLAGVSEGCMNKKLFSFLQGGCSDLSEHNCAQWYFAGCQGAQGLSEVPQTAACWGAGDGKHAWNSCSPHSCSEVLQLKLPGLSTLGKKKGSLFARRILIILSPFLTRAQLPFMVKVLIVCFNALNIVSWRLRQAKWSLEFQLEVMFSVRQQRAAHSDVLNIL